MSEPALKYPREALREWLQGREGRPPLTEDELGLLETLVDTLFFASLAKEEGRPALARIVYHHDGTQGLKETREHTDYDSSQGPALAWNVTPFRPILLTAKSLAKLTPAADMERTALIVGPRDDGRLYILGLARRNKATDGGMVTVLSAPEPGSVVLYQAGEELFRYERGQRLSPEQKFPLWGLLHNEGIVRQTIESICQNLVQTLAEASFFRWPNSGVWPVASLLFDLINTMASKRHGGLITLLPAEHEENPFYAISHHHSRFGELLLQSTQTQTNAYRLAFARRADDHSQSEEERGFHEEVRTTKESLNSLIENVGQLTALDNALLLGPDLKVIGAGFSVPTPKLATPTVHLAQDLQGTPGPVYDINQHGSRHRAATWFAFENPGGVAFLVSHDGPLRCLIRPSAKETTVLLWNLRLHEI
ncbi:putative sensor domain DACNV-containing protein [Archangium primigenium]|uniref:putative sensor domain DACNV-containing protein n=1 Tax=[Archangium] primigenium TaxID=2792470 RepID=UPI001959042B|nr:hypothetical protein [Archangium primigenium]MBM7119351.1 hypothetical protein [Archangium primigenium]